MSCHQQSSGSKFSQAMVQQTPAYDRRARKPRKSRKARKRKGLYD